MGIFTLPYADTGSTAGANNDYDEICPWDGSDSPDVVYAIKQSFDTYVAIDLCGSSYDTRVFVYDYLRNLVACNDDNPYAEAPCSGLDSRIDVLLLEAGIPYYIIIDGYGGGSGDYALSVSVTDNPSWTAPTAPRSRASRRWCTGSTTRTTAAASARTPRPVSSISTSTTPARPLPASAPAGTASPAATCATSTGS
ncbi:MAG: hypothetical protein IPH09_16325 [bacterium]|nr:hypothetical protein [bacterium]